MSQFYPLTVSRIDRLTRDSIAVSLQPDASDEERFRFTQGQYLTFRKMFDDTEVRRCYSVCASPDDGYLRVGIKRVDGGCFSGWANEELQVGDRLEAMTPSGKFYVPLEPDQKRHFVAFAAGSGITPILSTIRTVLSKEPLSSFTLVYGNKSANTIMFRDELDDLKNIHMDRLAILHVVGSENDLDLFSGRINGAKVKALLNGWIDLDSVDKAFICGPAEMMHEVSDALASGGMAKDDIKFELFGAAQPGQIARRKLSTARDGKDSQCAAIITVDGVTRDTMMAKVGQSILDAALAADLNAPFSCKAGVCSTCRAKVISGETEMLANYALEDYEIERGYVLACQCYPLSDKVVVDFDQ